MAILREQGVNSHVETAYAFAAAGFDSYDVHMTDLQNGRFDLGDAIGLVAGAASPTATLWVPVRAGHGRFCSIRH